MSESTNTLTLQVVSYNVHRSHQVLDSLFNNALTKPITILAIQEPPINPNTQHIRSHPNWIPILPALNTTIDSSGKRIRAHFYINKNVINYITNLVVHPLPSLDACLISLKLFDGPTTFFLNIYNPYPEYTALSTIEQAAQYSNNHPFHIMGDFNLHHPFWNPQTYNKRMEPEAEHLLDELTMRNFRLVSPKGIPTFRNHNSTTTIDLYFVNNKADPENQLSCSVNDNLDSSSDHLPLHLILPTSISTSVDNNLQRRNLRKTDWAKCKKLLKRLLSPEYIPIDSPEALDESAASFTIKIQTAIKESTPPLCIVFHTKRWWNEDLTNRRENLKRLRREADASNSIVEKLSFRIARGAYKRAIRQAKAKCWNEFLNNIPPQKLHLAAKYAKGIQQSSTFLPPLQRSDGSFTTTKDEQAQTIFDKIFNANNPLPTNYNRYISSQVEFHPVTIPEVTNVVKRLKNKKAAGPDGIQVEVIKELWEVIAPVLCEIANASIRLGYYPSCFKEATCVILKKPNRPSYSDPKAYRPISLLNHLSKIIESVITKRLQWEMESKNLLPPTHFGCRRGSGTDDALTYLTQTIHQAWQKKQVVTALALDAQGAFDNVLHHRLLKNCRNIGISQSLINWITGFLENRRICFRFSGTTSTYFNLCKGSPQGSPISGPLYLIYNHAMLNSQADVIKLGYADDILWLTTGSTVSDARTQLAAALPTADHWSHLHATPFDINKTQYIVFSRNGHKTDSTPLKWHNRNLQPSPVIKYLGLMIDSKLNYQHAINKMVQRGMATLSSLCQLANTQRGLRAKNFLTLYHTHVCAATDYAAHVWINTTSDNRTIHALNKIQNLALRKALGAFRTTSIASLQFDTSSISPKSRIRHKTERYLLRTATRKNNHIAKQTIEQVAKKPRKKFKSPLQLALANLQKRINIFEVEQILPILYPPWHETSIETSISNDSTTALVQYQKLNQQFPHAWHTYTDGSVGDGQVAAANYMNDTKCSAYKLGSSDKFTIFEAELIGLWLAFYEIMCNLITLGYFWKPNAVIIHTDSQAAIKTLQNYQHTNTGQYIVKEIIKVIDNIRSDERYKHTRLIVNWIPSHKDIQGNERADQIANATRTSIVFPRTSILIPSPQDNKTLELRPSFSALKQNLKQTHQAHLKVPAHKLDDGCSPYTKQLRGRMSASATFKILSQLPRRACSIAVQIRSGHFPTNTYLYRVNKLNTNKCNTCGMVDTIFHRLFVCQKYTNKRQHLKHILHNLRCPFNLKHILKHSEATLALTKFFEPQLISPR